MLGLRGEAEHFFMRNCSNVTARFAGVVDEATSPLGVLGRRTFCLVYYGEGLVASSTTAKDSLPRPLR